MSLAPVPIDQSYHLFYQIHTLDHHLVQMEAQFIPAVRIEDEMVFTQQNYPIAAHRYHVKTMNKVFEEIECSPDINWSALYKSTDMIARQLTRKELCVQAELYSGQIIMQNTLELARAGNLNRLIQDKVMGRTALWLGHLGVENNSWTDAIELSPTTQQ